MLPPETKTQQVEEVKELLDLIAAEEAVCLAAEEAKVFGMECCEVRERVKKISQVRKSLIAYITSAQTSLIYLRPIRCIVGEVRENFDQALALVSRFKDRILCKILYTHFTAQLRELSQRLDASINYMEWLVTVYDPQNGATVPTTNENPSPKFCIWACIAKVQMGWLLEDRVKAARCLAVLAKEQDEYKEIIIQESGIPPLQKLFKERSSLDAQIMVADALCVLANVKEGKEMIMEEMISTIVTHLSRTSPTRDQIQGANLVAHIAEYYPELKEYNLIREDVMWRLVMLLSSEPSAADSQTNVNNLELKISCSKALQVLAQGSLLICRTLTETKGMLDLAKLVETEKDDLQYNCLMIIKEITSMAERKKEFRLSAFKTSSPAAMAVVDQLLRVIEQFHDTKFIIPAIKSLGSLARMSSAKDRRVIGPLVSSLGSEDKVVVREAAIALQNFVCPRNHLSKEHSQSIIEFNGIRLIMKLLDGDKESEHHGLVLICYLAEHDMNSYVLVKAGALEALKTIGDKHPEIDDWISTAISKLKSNVMNQGITETPNIQLGTEERVESSSLVADGERNKEIIIGTDNAIG